MGIRKKGRKAARRQMYGFMFMPGILELACIFVLLALVAGIIAASVIAVTHGSRDPSDQNPNLTTCADCGGMVSVTAPACPHCGRPT